MLAKIFVPETEKPVTAGSVDIKVEKTAVNVIDAAAQGAGDGLHLALNIAGMLIAFLALIAMVQRHPGLGAHATADGLAAAFAGKDFRRCVCSGSVGDGRAVEGLRPPSAICWGRAWC